MENMYNVNVTTCIMSHGAHILKGIHDVDKENNLYKTMSTLYFNGMVLVLTPLDYSQQEISRES